MCTSIVVNRNKTIVGFNLDLLDMKWRVRQDEKGVYIEIEDAKEGWMPLFGANSRGDFVGMPTCWPFDDRSDPKADEVNVINLDIDLLLQKKSFAEIKTYAQNNPVCSIPGTTFMSALSDKDGNVLYIIPGQGFEYRERPQYSIMTNFSPFKMDSETHPWMGMDRYLKAEEMLKTADDDFDVDDCFEVLKSVAQEQCPTVVSMVFDVDERKIYWCENRNWERINMEELKNMENRNIGYCGLDCHKCDAYLATVNDDEQLRIKTAELWSKLNNVEILPEQIRCEGCRYDGVKTLFCKDLCAIRKCAEEKKVATCADCSLSENCETLAAMTANNPEAKDNLDKLKAM